MEIVANSGSKQARVLFDKSLPNYLVSKLLYDPFSASLAHPRSKFRVTEQLVNSGC
jgi:hypothetical protein